MIAQMIQVRLSDVTLPDWEWHYEDLSEATKLTTSLLRFGQLTPLIVCEIDECLTPEVCAYHGETSCTSCRKYEVIKGRRRLAVMRQLGWPSVWVNNLGRLTKAEAVKVALTLELTSETDYAKLARQVESLRDQPDFDSLPMTTPFTAERIRYFSQLLTWDWSQYRVEEQALMFADDDEPPPVKTIVEAVPDTQIKVVSTSPKVVVERKPAPAKPAAATPVSATNEADLRRAARAAVLLAAAPADAPLTASPVSNSLDDPFASFGEPERVRAITFGETPAPEVVSDWRPEPLPSLDGFKEIELDVETDGLKWWGGNKIVGFAVGYGDRRQYVPIRHQGGGNLPEEQVLEWCRRELKGKRITNIHCRLDHHMFYADGIDLEEQGNIWEDVAHYAALIDEYTRETNLDALAKQYLGQHKTGEGLDKSRMASYHASQVADYACQDIFLAKQLKQVMWPMMDAQDLHRVRQIEEDVMFPVCEMERNAAHVDRAALREATERCSRELNEMLFQIARELGFQMNPDRQADWVKLFNHYQIPITNFTAPSKKFPQGQPSFPDAVLAKVENPMVQLARRSGKLASLMSKFLTPYNAVIGADSKIRFALHQLRGDEYGTARGRFSMSGSSKGLPQFGANLQQVYSMEKQREAFGYDGKDTSHDHEIYLVRQFFTPEQIANHPNVIEYLAADAQAIEYRLAGHFADSEKLIDAYKKDPWVDFHQVVMDFVTPYKKIGRKTTKNLNFCKIYGGGKDTVAATLGMERAESDQIVAIYDRTFPEFDALLKKASNLMKSRGYVRTLAGRRARLDRWTVDTPAGPKQMDNAHAALNYVIQGSAADIMKKKLVELHRERKTTGFLMRQTVHDEVDGDSLHPERTPKAVAEILNVQSFDTKIPILWQVKTGKNWAEC